MKYNYSNYPNTFNINPITTPKKRFQSFTGSFIPDALTHVNIGNKPQGYIGKIKVRLAEGGEAVLNVFKRIPMPNKERYTIKNDYDELIGQMDITIKKYNSNDYDHLTYPSDPSHVFVDELKNFSHPETPYYTKGLTYHKDIGTRLLQIAQRRSDEAQCCGNIRLVSKGESKKWYLNIIGMRQENFSKFSNQNMLYLPPENKEPLSRLKNGL